jgi:hypothetical protein
LDGRLNQALQLFALAAKVAELQQKLREAKAAAEMLRLAQAAPTAHQTPAVAVAVAGLRFQAYSAPAAPAAPV